ncbi:hypothetical protein D7V93_19880, partial [Corallococcus llansteffanensis]
MGELYALVPEFGQKRLSQVVIPGTHNSGTYQKQGPVSDLARCQSDNIAEQLDNGMRFFDLRFERSWYDDGLYTHHGGGFFDVLYKRATPQQVFSSVGTFLAQHPHEVVILQLTDMTMFNDSAYDALYQIIWSNLGSCLARRPTTGVDRTLDDLISHNERAILTIETGYKPAAWQPYLWNKIISLYDETTYSSGDPQRIKQFIEMQLGRQPGPWVAQLLLTPDTRKLQSPAGIAGRINPLVEGWLLSPKWRDQMNIFITDFSEAETVRAAMLLNGGSAYVLAQYQDANSFALANTETACAPVVDGDTLYFVAKADNALMSASLYGTDLRTWVAGTDPDAPASAPTVCHNGTDTLLFYQSRRNTLVCLNVTRRLPPVTLAQGHGIASPPFYSLEGLRLYWQDSLNALWTCLVDGTDARAIPLTAGGMTWTLGSSPFVSAGYIYFQAQVAGVVTPGPLCRVAVDGTGFQQLGTYCTAASPWVSEGVVYYQGTDLNLYATLTGTPAEVRIGGEAEFLAGTAPTVLGSSVLALGAGGLGTGLYWFSTSGTDWECCLQAPYSVVPPVASGLYAYFVGDDTRIWRTRIRGTDTVTYGVTTKYPPVFAGDQVYWVADLPGQPNDSCVFRVDRNGSQPLLLSPDLKAACQPVIAGGFAYLADVDGCLCRVPINGGTSTRLSDHRGLIASAPCVAGNTVYFQSGPKILYSIPA